MYPKEGSKFDSIKFLDVCIDHNLSCKNHIAHISSKLSKSTGLIYKASHVFDATTLFSLHNAIYQPYLNHCCGNTYKVIVNHLFMKHKIICIICHAKFCDNTCHLFHNLQILNVFDFMEFKLVLLCIKTLIVCCFHHCKLNFVSLLVRGIVTILMSNMLEKFSISSVGVSLWNYSSCILNLSSSLSSFKAKLKNIFLINMFNFHNIP